jgi:hypothetical protein
MPLLRHGGPGGFRWPGRVHRPRGAGCLLRHPVPALRRAFCGLSPEGGAENLIPGERDRFARRPVRRGGQTVKSGVSRDVGRVWGNRLAGGHRLAGRYDHTWWPSLQCTFRGCGLQGFQSFTVAVRRRATPPPHPPGRGQVALGPHKITLRLVKQRQESAPRVFRHTRSGCADKRGVFLWRARCLRAVCRSSRAWRCPPESEARFSAVWRASVRAWRARPLGAVCARGENSYPSFTPRVVENSSRGSRPCRARGVAGAMVDTRDNSGSAAGPRAFGLRWLSRAAQVRPGGRWPLYGLRVAGGSSREFPTGRGRPPPAFPDRPHPPGPAHGQPIGPGSARSPRCQPLPGGRIRT